MLKKWRNRSRYQDADWGVVCITKETVLDASPVPHWKGKFWWRCRPIVKYIEYVALRCVFKLAFHDADILADVQF